jgi:hypothetical protein
MKRHQPALLGGLFIGVLSALPLLNFANCCCLWVLTGGMLTVYLQQQASATPVESSDAIVGGLIAGAIGGLLQVLISMAFVGMTGAMMQDQIRAALDQNPGLSPEMRDNILRFVQGRNLMLISAFVTVPLYAVFGMLGGLLGLAFFRKKTPPTPPAAPVMPV